MGGMSIDATTASDDATASLIHLLDAADAVPGAAELRAHSYELLRLAPGETVVDVGCGSGRAVAELAERGARPIGIDADDRMITAARRRWPVGDFRLGAAEQLPLTDGSAAGYRADKVFHELEEPADRSATRARVGWADRAARS